MATTGIVPAIDAYGTYGRASSLADYLEITALAGMRLDRAGLADIISDKGWISLMDELFTDPVPPAPRGDFEEEEEVEGDVDDPPGMPQAGRVFDVLAERVEILSDLYPFDLSDNELSLKPGFDVRGSAYVGILAITLAHAYRVSAPKDPKRVLEESVTIALAERGLAAVNVGEVSRRPDTDFRATVTEVGQRVGLRPTPTAAISNVSANEEGVDALAHLPWADSRPGNWVFIGQVTCGKSDTWKKKAGDPSPTSWKAYLNVGIRPLAFLVVPHHVEARHLTKLVQDTDRLVLDRLRLAHFRPTVTDDEAALVDAVLSVGVEQLA